MSWTPDPAALKDLVRVLHMALAPDTNIQRQVHQQLDAFNGVPEYASYLVYIFTQMQAETPSFLFLAGLTLKNTLLRGGPALRADVVEYVQSHIFEAFASSESGVRSAAGSVVVVLLALSGFQWLDGFQRLVEMLDSPDTKLKHSGFKTMLKLCEDHAESLDSIAVYVNGGSSAVRPAGVIVPKLISSVDSPDTFVGATALTCLNFFMDQPSTAMNDNMDAYLQCIFRHAGNSDSGILREVCHSFVSLLTVRPDAIESHLNDVVEFMLYSTQSADPDVALEAAEFWLAFAEEVNLHETLRPFLDRLIPILLKGMVYSEESLLNLEEDDDAAVPDSDQDIKPQFAKSSVRGEKAAAAPSASASSEPSTSSNANSANSSSLLSRLGGFAPGTDNSHVETRAADGSAGANDDEDEDDDDMDDAADDDLSMEWNLRKCCAASLDVLSGAFPEQVAAAVLPVVSQLMFDPDWLKREAAILALGAITTGCMDAVAPHIRELTPHLLSLFNDPKPLVRSITVWTVGRYSQPIIHTASPQLISDVINGMLHIIADPSKRVQEAGCSAFATFEEEAGPVLCPFLPQIVSVLTHALSFYQRKNRILVYDAIGTLAMAVGPKLDNPQFADQLIPPLMLKFDALPDDSPDLIPLVECLASLVVSVHASFVPYVQSTYERAVSIIRNTITNTEDVPDPSFITIAIDLISGLIQGLGADIAPLFANSSTIIEILAAAVAFPDASVRQTAFALLGDISISIHSLIAPHLTDIFPFIIQNIKLTPPVTYDVTSVANNACWAAGEIALRADPAVIQPFINPLLENLVPVLKTSTPVALVENAAIAIGRLAIVAHAHIATIYPLFIDEWLAALADIRDNSEKDSAFCGICLAIIDNPAGIANRLPIFLEAIAKSDSPSPHLHRLASTIISSFKAESAAAWSQQLAHLNPMLVTALQRSYPI